MNEIGKELLKLKRNAYFVIIFCKYKQIHEYEVNALEFWIIKTFPHEWNWEEIWKKIKNDYFVNFFGKYKQVHKCEVNAFKFWIIKLLPYEWNW